jgi:hypothetical protein
MEALAAYTSIGNKFSVKEIVYQLVDKNVYDLITERIDQEMVPFINQDGALEIPYLDHIDTVGQSNNASAIMLPNVSRRESLSSNTVNKQYAN